MNLKKQTIRPNRAFSLLSLYPDLHIPIKLPAQKSNQGHKLQVSELSRKGVIHVENLVLFSVAEIQFPPPIITQEMVHFVEPSLNRVLSTRRKRSRVSAQSVLSVRDRTWMMFSWMECDSFLLNCCRCRVSVITQEQILADQLSALI